MHPQEEREWQTRKTRFDSDAEAQHQIPLHMPDFGPRWIDPKPLDKGGQALTYVVRDAEDPTGVVRVAKVLNNPEPDRKRRFLQEIEVTKDFDHMARPRHVSVLG